MVVLLNAASPLSQGWRSFTAEYQRGLCFKKWAASKLPFARAYSEDLSCHTAEQTSANHIHMERATEGPILAEVSFDKSKFDVPYNLLALRVPKQHSGSVSKALRGYVFDMPRVRHIIHDPADPDKRLIILSEEISDAGLSEIPAEKLASLSCITDFEVIPHQVVLDYDYWPADHILKGLLPHGCDIQSAFETVGHIAHLNIRDELAAYKHLIASVILEKNKPKIRTVLNKVGTISNQFRVPKFEVLAGDPCLVTEVKQYGAIFQLDYGLVYWNSRLEHEHKRLVSQFLPKHVICDMFAGIGPFAIPAARKGCIVYANDLNPDSVKYLKINTKINKVINRVHIFKMDARDFIRHITNPEAPISAAENQFKAAAKDKPQENEAVVLSCLTRDENRIYKSSRNDMDAQIDLEFGMPSEHIDHIIMNLPASALDFLDAFNGIFSKERWKGKLPRIHCYCFMRAHETTADVLKFAESVLGSTIVDPMIWEVRDVAPNKVMLCISFDLPEDVAFGVNKKIISTISAEQDTTKRPRLEARTCSSCS